MVLISPTVHLVGSPVAPELIAFARELQQVAPVYSFETTTDLLAAWQIARRNGAAKAMTAAAVVWLQARSGEFAQREIEDTAALDPLAKPIVVAGCWSEGEPRSGRPLTGVTRVYWHQGARAILPLIAPVESEPTTSQWIAIHAARQLGYQGVAGVCQSLGQQTIWQADRWPAISSEPALRIFVDWSSWQAWREVTTSHSAAILLLNFPRLADQQRARAEGIVEVIAQPLRTADLKRAISHLTASTRSTLRRHDRQEPQPRPAAVILPRRRSA